MKWAQDALFQVGISSCLGGLAFAAVAKVKSCGAGRPASAKVHVFLVRRFWGQLPEPAFCVLAWAAGRAGVTEHRGGDGTGPGQSWLLLPCSLCSAAHTLLWNMKCCCSDTFSRDGSGFL